MHDETSLWRESGLRLSGFGHYYPRLQVENESAEAPAGNAVDEAVIGRLDVRSRHVADEEETPRTWGCAPPVRPWSRRASPPTRWTC